MTKKGEVNVSEPQPEDSNDETSRGQWSNQFDFLLSCIGYAVGLGNVWRFPYLCYRNGGGAFLIPYVIALFTAGLPLFFMELALGQYASLGPNVLFRNFIPLFQGLGYGMIAISILVALYYNMIIAWSFFYLFASFTSELGWEKCGHEYNTKGCFTVEQDNNCRNVSSGLQFYYNNTCYNISDFCEEHGYPEFNETMCLNGSNATKLGKVSKRLSPSEDYFENYMLSRGDATWENFGEPTWQLTLCLLLAWIVVGLCLIKGVKSSGKVVYFTAIFPYLVLIILLGRGASLPGAADGVYFYMSPKWERLANSKVWVDAFTQIFYSLGPSFGGLLTMASYNRFNNNCMRDAITVALINCGTSVFAGFVIFSIMGFMAHELGVKVDDVIQSGTGLAFIVYPDVVTRMPVSPLWSILFFGMLITLGLDSQFTMVETITTAIMDKFTNLRKYKAAVVLSASFIGFILGLSLCAPGGVYMFTLLDWYSASWSLLILSCTEILLVSWVYGAEKFLRNIMDDMGIHVPIILYWYWRITWQIISPILLVGILVFSFVYYAPASYGDYTLPIGANALGWMMAASTVLFIPGFVIYRLVFKKQSLHDALQPTEDWKPAHERAQVFIKQPTYSTTKDEEAYDNPVFPSSYDNPPSYHEVAASSNGVINPT